MNNGFCQIVRKYIQMLQLEAENPLNEERSKSEAEAEMEWLVNLYMQIVASLECLPHVKYTVNQFLKRKNSGVPPQCYKPVGLINNIRHTKGVSQLAFLSVLMSLWPHSWNITSRGPSTVPTGSTNKSKIEWNTGMLLSATLNQGSIGWYFPRCTLCCYHGNSSVGWEVNKYKAIQMYKVTCILKKTVLGNFISPYFAFFILRNGPGLTFWNERATLMRCVSAKRQAEFQC